MTNCIETDVLIIGCGIAGGTAALQLADAGVPVTVVPESALMRPADVPRLVCDSSEFRKLTGWEPKYILTRTLSDLYDYWLNRLKKEVLPTFNEGLVASLGGQARSINEI